MNEELIERLKIRELVENWALWRDANDWDRFRTVWAPEGRMMATWTQGTFEEFIGMSQAGFAKGVRILHFLGGSTIEVNGPRAIALTKMTISQRGKVHDVLCDVVCTGRFCDFLRKMDDGSWGLSLRQPIYEKDRMDPVDPAAKLELDPQRLARFPEGYRHLAYLQSLIGYPVKTDMPGLTGPEVEALYARCRAWLAGESKTIDARG
ncbi:MAG TPA: nuclear transport factor 2 family protein [Bryobacteraceae bacterium]|nr:nuclear transport factor 2 family protein [Bryobacteraceae bacterium]